jgi:hypothetical protein
MKKIIISLAIIGALTAGIVYWWVFVHNANYKGVDVSKKESLVISIDSLSEQYLTNEAAFNEQYLNKVLEISGTIKEVVQDSFTNIVLQGKDSLAQASCQLIKKDEAIVAGKMIVIKGICTGATTDLITNGANLVLNDGIIVNK